MTETHETLIGIAQEALAKEGSSVEVYFPMTGWITVVSIATHGNEGLWAIENNFGSKIYVDGAAVTAVRATPAEALELPF